MSSYSWKKFLKRNTELQYVSFFGEPVVLHCHHFNLFLQQTIEDPPYVDGEWILFRNAYEVSFSLLKNVASTLSFRTKREFFDACADLSRFLGFGTLEFHDVTSSGGTVLVPSSHYSEGWIAKYARTSRRSRGVDYFLRGFVSAVWNIAYEKPEGTYSAVEIESPVTGGQVLKIQVTENPSPIKLRPSPGPGWWKSCSRSHFPIQTLESDFPIETFTNELTALMDNLEGDERGLIAGFHVYVTRHLANYYSGISYDFYEAVRHIQPNIEPVARELLEESGHVCVFHTFGNLLMNDDIQALAGGFSTKEDYVYAGVSVGRALGFGDWDVASFEPGHHLSVGASCEYEGAYLAGRHIKAPLFFLPGATSAIMNMVYVGKIDEKPELTSIFYNKLMKSKELFRSSIESIAHETGTYTLVRAQHS